MPPKLTRKEVDEKFKTVYNGEYKLVSDYVNNHTPVVIMHIPCGSEFKINRLSRFFSENGCTCPVCYPQHVAGKCHSTSVITEDILIEKLKTYKNGEYEYISGYTKTHEKCLFKHSICGKTFSMTPHKLFSKNRFKGCPMCESNIKQGAYLREKSKNYLQDALDEADDGDEYEWMGTFIKNNIPVKIKHKTCGTVYEVRPRDFRYAHNRCPNCSADSRRSSGECEVAEEIQKIYDGEILTNDRTAIYPKELDIYLPELKLAIEYNGLYWHNEDNVGKDAAIDKYNDCLKNGIRLIQIFEDEWLYHKDIVIDKISSIIIKKSDKPRVYGRDLVLRLADTEDVKILLNENHIQGYTEGSIYYGAYGKKDNILYATMGIRKLRDSMSSNVKTDKNYEITRSCYNNKYIIVGLFPKFLKYFKTQGIAYVRSIADMRYSDPKDNVYLNNKFTVAKEVPARYYYTKGTNRYFRFNFRKDKIKGMFPEIYNENLTEFQMMDKTKYRRIWDAGKITYEKYL